MLILYIISNIHYISYTCKIYAVLYIQNYITEEIKNYSMNLLKKKSFCYY